jgi:hypothetical protein
VIAAMRAAGTWLRRTTAALSAATQYAVSWLLFLFLLLGIPYVSWDSAGIKLEEGERLRVYYVARRDLSPGTKLTAADVEIRGGYVSGDPGLLAAAQIVGKFAVAPVEKDEVVTRASVAERFEMSTPADHAMALVQVDRADSLNIQSGTRVALVREKTVEEKDAQGKAVSRKEPELIGFPSCTGDGAKGLRVMSVLLSDDKAQPSLLRIQLERSQVALAPPLALHKWKPIPLGEGVCGAVTPDLTDR